MAPLSNAERQRRFRARRDADQERRQMYLESEQQRWRRDVEGGQKKLVKNLNERDQRQLRKKWREQNGRRKQKKAMLGAFHTPPESPENVQPGSADRQQAGPSRQHEAGKRLWRKNKDRLKKEVEKLTKLLEKERKRSDKYRKKYKRSNKSESPRSKVQQLTKSGRLTPTIRKKLLYHEALIEDIKNKYKTARKEREKQLIAKVTVGGIVKRYRLQTFAEKLLGFSKKRRFLQGETISSTTRKPTSRLRPGLKAEVHSFYRRDDVSRITTGRKQTITRGKVKKQKRFLMDTMKNLHRKFVAEQGHFISYSLFCRLRPFWVVHPTLSDRETCLCKIHENLEFVVMKMYHSKLIETTNLESLTKMITCDFSNKACMYDECVECKNKIIQLPQFDAVKTVTFPQWATAQKVREDMKDGTTVRYTLKKLVEDSQGNLVDLFHAFLHKFKRHTFNIIQQYSYCRKLKENLTKEEAIIHIDFSENYSCKYSSEIQSVRFGASQNQATLHTGVLYLGGDKEVVPFCSVSPSKQKGPPAIWEHMAPVLDHVQTNYPLVSVLHFLSDGPCTQYKQKRNLYLFSTELARRGLKGGTWNFFEASHGKGAPDGVGGALKRTADQLVNTGSDIPDAHTLFLALSNTTTSIKLFFIPAEAVDHAVQQMQNQIPPVPSIMKCHQVVTYIPGEVLYREVSCMCSTKKQLNCQCFNTLHFSFHKPAPKAPKAPNAPIVPVEREVEREGIDWESENVIGSWCVIKYDSDLYPGIILNTDETHAQVKCLHKGGNNKFFWPLIDDILWYLFDDVQELIQPPQPVTSRHVGIEKEVWKRLSATLQ